MTNTKKTSIPIWGFVAIVLFALIGTSAILYSRSTQNNKGLTEIETKYEDSEKQIEHDNEVIVIFEDEILEQYIREELFKPTGDITSTDMLDLYSLNINEFGVENLTGLEYALGLNSFTLAKENVQSLEPIKNLTSLERFSLRYSTIEDLPVQFDENVNLNHVSIVNTQIKDVSFLTHMTNVEHLTMTDAEIVDISPIKNLNKITQLNLRGNEIVDISAIAGKNNLDTLSLQKNLISDITPLAGLEKLDDLVLSFNPIYELEPLKSLPSLRELVIYLDHDVKHLIFDQVKELEGMGIDVGYST